MRTKKTRRTYPKGTLQFARAETAARIAAGDDVDALDLGGGRITPRIPVERVLLPEAGK